MDRVNIPGEAPGSATYYMSLAPEEHGLRIFDMEHYGDVQIREVRMDIGTQKSQPHVEVHSSQEFDNLVWKSPGKTIYSCQFDVMHQGLDVTVILDFTAKRLTLEVDPSIDLHDKQKLANFVHILSEPDYYEQKELEEMEGELTIPKTFRNLAIIAAGIFLVSAILDLTGVFPDQYLFPTICEILCWSFMTVYWIVIAVKKHQIKRRRSRS